MPLRFFDYKQTQLIGMLVLWTTRDTKGVVKQIVPIAITGKTGFQIQGHSDKWFSYKGQQKGFKNTPNSFSICQLISEQEAEGIRYKWTKTKEKLRLIHTIKTGDLSKVDLTDLASFADKITDRAQQASSLDDFDSTLSLTPSKSTSSSNDEVQEAVKRVEQLYDDIKNDTDTIIDLLKQRTSDFKQLTNITKQQVRK